MLLLNGEPFNVYDWAKKIYGKGSEYNEFLASLRECHYVVPKRKIRADKLNGGFQFGRGTGILSRYETELELNKPGEFQKVEIQYYKTVEPHPTIMNHKVYLPVLFETIPVRGYFQVMNVEDNFFLKYHPSEQANAVKLKKKARFEKYNKVSRIQDRKKYSDALRAAMNLAYGEHGKLSDESLRSLCLELEADPIIIKSFQHGLHNVNEMDIDDLRDHVDRLARVYPEHLLGYYKKSNVIMREEIEEFRQEGILLFETTGSYGPGVKGKWLMVTDKKKEEICTVMNGQIAENVLITLFRNGDIKNILRQLREMLQPVVAA